MATAITKEIRAKAEFYDVDEICQEKAKEFLREVGLPNGLLPLKDFIECGFVHETGFVWMKQKKKITHKFEKVDKLVTYDTTVTAFVEKNKIKKLTGVKAKLLIWATISDIYVDDPPTGKITFKSPTGIFRTFPVSSFEIEEDVKEVKDSNEVTEVKNSNEPKEVKGDEGLKEVKVDEGLKKVKIDEAPKEVEIDEGLMEVKIDEGLKEEVV